jgi:hypothetical protein
VATYTTSALAVGNHALNASYAGDASFNTGTGNLTGTPQVVTKSDAATMLTSSQNPSILNQSVTFTAVVSPVAPGAGLPTGNVTFLDNASSIGTVALSGGTATLTTSALAVGPHPITTTYAGDTNFNNSGGTLVGTPQVVSVLGLSVSDSHGYARYGATMIYVVTVSNSTASAIGGLTIAGSDASASAAFNTAAGSWVCAGTAAQCAPSGSGAFQDANVTIPANGSVTWTVSVPLLSNTSADTADYRITLTGTNPSVSKADSDILVLFRDGFQANGDGMQ